MEEIRFILHHLNGEPFNKKLNVISYDNLRAEQRVEILFQIFHQIDPTVKNGRLALVCILLIDFFFISKTTVPNIQLVDPEELVIRILEMLRICKYQPPATMKA